MAQRSLNPSKLPAFERARVLVAGDVMLDRYWYGGTSRISPEAPVPVVHVQEVEERLGGAGNVAANIRALGARALLCGVVGRDDAGRTLERLLEAHAIDARLSAVAGYTTVTKMRVISRHQQLIRLDFEPARVESYERHLEGAFRTFLPECDVVVLSDYGKGALYDCGSFIAEARAAGKQVLVDPKGTDFARYRNASVITPNLAELEAVVGGCRDLDELSQRGSRLIEELDLEALLVTRSEQGMTLLERSRRPLHLAAEARDVFDVTGAGDTVIGVLAASLATGASLVRSTELANVAAGIVVTKLGTACPTQAELANALGHAGGAARGMVAEGELAGLLERARARGEKLVLTNGCFDILHAGHVRYLSEAARLGDRLIVAVNDDASVARLKGSDRPVNTLPRRMAVLAALDVVDWVVPFSEDTPERLIRAIRPDVLVKGGDYRPDEMAGGDFVRAQGGEVRVIDIEEECSTSAILRSLMTSGGGAGLDS